MKKKLFIIAACVVCILGIFSCDWDALASSSSSSSKSCPSGGLTLSSYNGYSITSSSACSSGCASEYEYYNNYYCWTGSTCYCYH